MGDYIIKQLREHIADQTANHNTHQVNDRDIVRVGGERNFPGGMRVCTSENKHN